MLGWADGWLVDQGSHGDVNKGAVPDQRVEQRAARFAVRVVSVLIAEDHKMVLAFGDFQLIALDAGESLESRAGRTPAVRAMTVCCVHELVRDRVFDGAAE